VDAALGAFQVGAQRDDTAVLALTLRDGRALTGAAARPAGSEPAR
jgi:hypothetical protein